ncbi:MAG: hypothetical protein AAFN10_15005, partial [Bacteroidota bacterium]
TNEMRCGILRENRSEQRECPPLTKKAFASQNAHFDGAKSCAATFRIPLWVCPEIVIGHGSYSLGLWSNNSQRHPAQMKCDAGS